MNVYPYGVLDYVYNFNSSFPFLIVMLNTTKLYTFPNYRYEYVVSSHSNWFNIKDDIVQAIFSMFKKNNISILDNVKTNKYIKQYVLEKNNKSVFVAEKEFQNENCYLWSISAYHYYNQNNLMMVDDKSKVIIYGIWVENIYYPCKASIETLESSIPNQPYLLVKRRLDDNNSNSK
ncbi:hypothetical protein PIROE2DRAFT_14689 [Piromyces sp. E2]|nr:hypothetical protein PIROE2DRAFT_14689 [Piromyces sp. E2]|eukprot:OUM59718.1 hypothetical protein PIROE2DRAFT_14689 [Piromyces sp. E2]